MRLWHKDLIRVLPRQQLISQWRECCLIAQLIAEKGTPNHILVNVVADYPIQHLIYYASIVRDEMTKRGYKCDWNKFGEWINSETPPSYVPKEEYIAMFHDWMNGRYYTQCFYNLQEKYDRGGLDYLEWARIARNKEHKGEIR